MKARHFGVLGANDLKPVVELVARRTTGSVGGKLHNSSRKRLTQWLYQRFDEYLQAIVDGANHGAGVGAKYSSRLRKTSWQTLCGGKQ
jgi:hypothetical protein